MSTAHPFDPLAARKTAAKIPKPRLVRLAFAGTWGLPALILACLSGLAFVTPNGSGGIG